MNLKSDFDAIMERLNDLQARIAKTQDRSGELNADPTPMRQWWEIPESLPLEAK